MTRQNKLISVIEDLPPAYFAIVMATGIVSIAAHFVGFHLIALVLLWLNVVFYVFLWFLTITRIICHSERFAKEFQDFNRGVGYLTTVAGTCILGSQFVILEKAYQTGLALLCFGLGVWVLVVYTVFSSFAIRTGKPSIQDGISGAWLLATVSAQSLSVLAGRLTARFLQYQEVFLFFSTCMFLLGCALYFVVVTIIFYRLMFQELAPEKLSPTYWINMGAVAISTLAGLVLAEACNGCPVFDKLVPFIFGLTLMCWSMATWWIPMLCVLMFWRHVARGVKLSYSPEYWSMVFPLGMYTACTMKLSEDFNLNFLYEIPHYFIYLAFAAWMMTFFGLLKSIYHFFVNSEVDKDSEKSLIG